MSEPPAPVMLRVVDHSARMVSQVRTAKRIRRGENKKGMSAEDERWEGRRKKSRTKICCCHARGGDNNR